MRILTDGIIDLTQRFEEHRKSVEQCDKCIIDGEYGICELHKVSFYVLHDRYWLNSDEGERKELIIKFCMKCRNPYVTGNIADIGCLSCKFDFFKESFVTKFKRV